MKKKDTKKGFTLVELIVVIAIVAVIAAIAIPSYFGIINSSKKSAAMEDARTMYTMLFHKISENNINDSHMKLIYKWTDDSGGQRPIIYNGPTDNSVSGNVPSHHDYAKNAVKDMLGKDVVEFGYRIYIGKDTDGSHTIEKIEVFYKKPKNAAITAESGDFIIDSTNVS